MESVLIASGCGFTGDEVVCVRVKEPRCSVSVVRRNPHKSRVDDVAYYKWDITVVDSLAAVMREIQPRLLMPGEVVQWPGLQISHVSNQLDW